MATATSYTKAAIDALNIPAKYVKPGSGIPKADLVSAVQDSLGKADSAASDSSVVKLSGAQTVAGIKTFSSSPVIPEPTSDGQAATKKYVDDNSGGGTGGAVSSVNEKTGEVVLTAADVEAEPAGLSDDTLALLEAQYVRFVVITTGSEARPGDTGGLVIWMDTRIDTSVQPAAMEPQDVRWIAGEPTPPVDPVAPSITTASLNAMVVDSHFTQTLAATGTAPITWSATGVPDGLALNAGTGVLVGTPTTEGAYSMVVTATNDTGDDTKTYTGTVTASVPPAEGEHNIFGSTVPAVLTTATDAEAGAWVSQQFYITGTPERSWFVAGLRLYVADGSVAIGQSFKTAFVRKSVADGGVILKPANPGFKNKVAGADPNGTVETAPDVLMAGWNEVHFATKYAANSLDSLMVGVSIGDGTIYEYSNGGITEPLDGRAVQSSDGSNLFVADIDEGRCAYNDTWATTDIRWYGIDIILSETDD